jgi:poly-gamma-glutamate synthesis protein (capsule biosynthesis protein)
MFFLNKKAKNFYSWLFIFSSVVLFFVFLNYKIIEFECEFIQFNRASLSNFKKEEEEFLNLFFVGDIMLDRGVEYMIEKKGFDDYKFPFLKIKPELEKADILFGNLEGPISDKGEKVGSIYSFRAEPESMGGLAFAGFNVLSFANNHIFDYGRKAFEDTLLRLKEAGIGYIGAGFSEKEAYSPLIKEAGGTKISYLAYTSLGSKSWQAQGDVSGIAWLEEERIKDDIKKAKDASDIIIVSFHYGMEYEKTPDSFQEEISRLAIDSGADLVVGHHPHVVQPIEKYKQGYIVYSLGNFVFDQGFSEETKNTILLEVLVKDKKIREINSLNIKINEYFQPELVNKNN